MSGLVVTRLRGADQVLLRRLAEFDEEAFGPVALRTYDLAVVLEAGAIYLAWSGEEVVGACQLLRLLDEPSFLYVVGFYVRPAWRGRGLGRELLRRVAEEARGLGAEGLLLTVSPGNQAALALYHGAGFVREALVQDFYGKGEDRLILRWRFGGA